MQEKPRRRWLQFSLKRLMGAMLAISVGLGLAVGVCHWHRRLPLDSVPYHGGLMIPTRELIAKHPDVYPRLEGSIDRLDAEFTWIFATIAFLVPIGVALSITTFSGNERTANAVGFLAALSPFPLFLLTAPLVI